MSGVMSCSGGSSGTATSSPRVELKELIIYQGSPAPPTPTATSTPGKSPTATPTMTARPMASSTVISSVGGTAQYGAQGIFQKGGNVKNLQVQDLTNSSLFTSSDPGVLEPPNAQPSATPGVYLGVATGCACAQVSNSNQSSNPVTVGVVTNSCPACPTLAPTPTATPKGAAKQAAATSEAAVAPATPDNNAGVLSWTFNAHARLSGNIAANGGRLYFITTDGILHAVNGDGTESFKLAASGSSPIPTSNGLIAFPYKSGLEAIMPNGALVWHVPLASAGGPIATAGDTIYVATSKGLSSVSVDGQHNWTVQAGSVDAVAATADGVVVASNGGGLTALALDGALSWTFSPAGGFAGALSTQGNVIYAGSGSGIVYALDSSTGKVTWQLGLAGQISAGPTISDSGTIYVTEGAIYAISSEGKVLWQQNGTAAPGGPLVPTGAQDVFDAASDSLAVMLGADGTYIWSSRSFGTITTAASAGGVVYVATDSGNVYAVR